MTTYVVKWASTGQTNGKPSISVPEKTYNDTATSLVLTGKGLNNYGLFQQENFLKLLENFANADSPDNPTVGQLWYDTASCQLKVYSCAGRWVSVSTGRGDADIVASLEDYMGDGSSEGFAERINKIIGTPITSPSQYGWGQLDYVPTYDSTGNIDTLALSRQDSLPSGLSFPGQFNNSAWAIAVSRLRKALRQVGLAESSTSTIGFISDGNPAGTGNQLANIYNNNTAGQTPYQGTLSNILAGFSTFTMAQVGAFFTQTETALDQLELYRFSLGASQTQIQNLINRTRTAPAQTLTISSSGSTYQHIVEVEFGSYENACAFFNSGGQMQFNSGFVPSNLVPSNVENDWKSFLLAFTGFCFDYQGIKKTSAYASPSFTPSYMQNGTSSGGPSIGFYELTSTSQVIFRRDVLQTPGLLNPYSDNPPINGGLIIESRTISSSGSFKVRFDISYVLRFVTTGAAYQNDTSDTSLTGTLTSSLNAIYANNLNRNLPAQASLIATDSGTFISAA